MSNSLSIMGDRVPADSRLAVIRALNGTRYGLRRRNCWWLALEIQKRLFGRDLPLGEPRLVLDERARSAAVQTHPERAGWPEVPVPVDGALVLMGRSGLPDLHCGVFLSDLAAVVHSDRPHGVTFDPLAVLRLRWSRITFHVPA